MKRQLFSDAPLRVKIIEKFYLSRQYTPEKLMEVYRSSILLELKQYNILLFHMLQTARVSFPEEGKCELVLCDTVIGREKEEELYQILDKIFNERCGMKLAIHVGYYRKEDSRALQNSELQMRAAARQVAEHTRLASEAEQDQQENGKEKDETDGRQKAAGGQDGSRRGQGQGSRSENGRGKSRRGSGELPLRRSGSPDVLYGRDFDEESIPIDSIEGDIGDVVIRGQILSFDSRELRNGRGACHIYRDRRYGYHCRENFCRRGAAERNGRDSEKGNVCEGERQGFHGFIRP